MRMRVGQFAVLMTLLLLGTNRAESEAGSATVALFDRCAANVDAQLTRRIKGAVVDATDIANGALRAKLQLGELVIEDLGCTDKASAQGGLLHHWRGMAFVPGVTASDLNRLLREIDRYPQVYAPQVERATVTGGSGDHLQISLRVRQKHVLTVVMNTDYDVVFGGSTRPKGWSISRSTRISEIDSPGTTKERVLGPNEEHGFLWKQNTYWTWEERDGGVYMEIESVSLSRDIPAGLGWLVRPFADAVPRESLEFTLRKTREALAH